VHGTRYGLSLAAAAGHCASSTVRSVVTPTTPHQAIYRRWRAQTFGQIVGQEAVVETLRNAVRTGRVSHGVLFVGPRGTGKTSLARILAKAINCTDLRDGEPCDACSSCVAIREGRTLDLFEIDAASHRGIDAIRELRERVHYPPGELARKVYILDEAHQITKDAWPVLLKTLEEPPDFVNFMFASTEPSQFPAAILSRLQRFDLRRLTVAEIAGKLRTILEGDGRSAEPDAIDLIARLAAGGMRDAESMLDQLLGSDGGVLTADRVRDVLGLVEEETVESFLAALVSGQAVAGIELLDGLEEHGRDLPAFTEQAIERLRVALVASLGRGTAGGLAEVGTARLAAAARRLASIDPKHPGPGGLRLQLELALLEPGGGVMAPVVELARPAAPEPIAAKQESPKPEPPAPKPSAAGQASTPRPRSAPKPEPSAPKPEPLAPKPEPLAPRTRGGGPALQQLIERWPEIVEVVSKHPPTRPLIIACRPIAVDGAVVTLGFPEGQSFLRDVAERRRAILEDGVARVLGMPVTVRCVAANVEVAPLAEDPDGGRLLSEFKRIFSDESPDVGEVE
jgi:DNA polymerase-3 subunit gamma/tau